LRHRRAAGAIDQVGEQHVEAIEIGPARMGPGSRSAAHQVGEGAMMARRVRVAALIIVIAVVVGAALGWNWAGLPAQSTESGSAIGGPFTLVDHRGVTVTDQTYRGKWLMIFFGFTFCPDVCPTTLNEFAEALNALGPAATRVQPLFITVDPDRDTPDVLRDYIEAFDSRIVGLTGRPEQIAAVAKAYHAFYRRAGKGPDYRVDHTGTIYIVDPNGRFNSRLRHDTPGTEMAAHLKKLL
jgi:protein SCO1/2